MIIRQSNYKEAAMMKRRIKRDVFGWLLMLVGATLFLPACPGKNNPTSPSQPPADTATNTPVSGTGTPTSTTTLTPTNTVTSTSTSTPTNSPTKTPTASPTSTSTNAAANTATSTPSNTVSLTPSMTATSTTTNTVTLTVTATPSSTASATPTPTGPTATPTATFANLNPGDIAFTGFVQNGSSEFSFVSTKALNPGQTIYFTNQGYDDNLGGLAAPASFTLSGSTASDPNNSVTVTDNNFGGESVVISDVYNAGDNDTVITEGIIAYTVGSGGLPAYTEVVLSKESNDLPQQQGGTAVTVSGTDNSGHGNVLDGSTTVTANWAGLVLNHNGVGHKVLAFTVSGGVTQYVAGLILGPDTWQTSGSIGSQAVSGVTYPFFWDSCLPPGLTNGTNAIDLSGLWATDDLNAYNLDGTQNQNALLSCGTESLAYIVAPGDWTADGNVPKPSTGCTACLGLGDLAGTTTCSVGQVGWNGLPASTPPPTNTSTSTPTITNTPTATSLVTNTSTNTPTITATPTITNTPLPLGPGSIVFTALLQNGCSEFDLVAPGGLAGGTTIYFTNGSYNPTSGVVTFIEPDPNVSGNGVTEGVIAYVVPSGGLGAYVPVAVSKLSNDDDMLAGGSLVDISDAPGDTASEGVSTEPFLIFNHNGEGHKIIAYSTTGANSTGVTTYLAALIFGPDTWQTSGSVTNYWDSYLPQGLTSGTNAMDLSGVWTSNNLESLYVQGNDNAVLNSCQNTTGGIMNTSNWAVDGNVGAGTMFLVNSGSPLVLCATGSAGWTGTIPPSVYLTATPTPTNSPTPTASVTADPTDTPTLVSTNTSTSTITNTPLPANTPTNSPSGTPTATPSNTASSTPTGTPTNTPTNTKTPTITPTPSGNFLTGTITYDGSMGTVSEGSPIEVGIYTSPNLTTASAVTTTLVSTNSSTYTFTGLTAGTNYYVACLFNVNGTGTVFDHSTYGYPITGDPYFAYNGITNTINSVTSGWPAYGQGGTTAGNTATAIAISSGGNTLNLTFGDTNVSEGFNGQPDYTGSLVTLGTAPEGIYAVAYTSSTIAYTNRTPADDWGVNPKNTTNVNLATLMDEPVGTPLYVQIFADSGNALTDTSACGGMVPCIQSGDPYTIIGPIDTSTNVVPKSGQLGVTFNDAVTSTGGN